jgi:hypothetical protein
MAAVQQPPTAAELLASIVEVITDEVVPALTGPVQHRARVAANIAAIVERELRLGAEAASRELTALATLLDDDGTADLADLPALRRRLSNALRQGLADDDATNERVWHTLMAVVRDDLSIAKPGHDQWEGK